MTAFILYMKAGLAAASCIGHERYFYDSTKTAKAVLILLWPLVCVGFLLAWIEKRKSRSPTQRRE